MIKSMTGYGTARYADDTFEVTVEVKSLNSKFLDLSMRTGRSYSDKEMEIRNAISEKLVRGKIAVNIDYQLVANNDTSVSYNQALFENYYKDLKALANSVGDNSSDLFKIALQSPDVTINKTDEKGDELNWEVVKKVFLEALHNCDTFRIDEGSTLNEKLSSYIQSIRNGLTKVEALDPDRVAAIRTRITNNMNQFIDEEKIDKNRLEQELIFYIEKLDISEEKVRLTKHLDYYDEVMNSEESNGKKLGFISQEIGREINTIGSKANDATIQQIVVGMKEELEKIKEQVLNVL
ncbi:MAG: YicC family protein [Cyclobacteriaceae bacterium]|nr:YicC family protein [Cyclobacteriaceae bacterium]